MKKKIIIIIMIVIIVVITIPITVTIINEKQEELKMKELRIAYRAQNISFGGIVEPENDLYKYKPINPRQPNIDGIAGVTYMILASYRKETVQSLTYEQVIDYLSQEFEDNGEIRIYTNGQHPEIATFIKWADENTWMHVDYRSKLKDIYSAYANEREGFPICDVYLLPIEMIDELIKKEADPNYKMDLKTIQDRYIEEGKAKVLEDGKTIEFIVPES